MLSVFDAKKRLIGNAGFLGKICVGKIATFFTEKFRQLLVQIASHFGKVARILSRMRDAFALQKTGYRVKSEKPT